MYIKYSVDEKLLLLLGFSVAYLLAGASMFEQPGQANSQLISILAPFLSGAWGTTEGRICEKLPLQSRINRKSHRSQDKSMNGNPTCFPAFRERREPGCPVPNTAQIISQNHSKTFSLSWFPTSYPRAC
jgi:hypothetical protein